MASEWRTRIKMGGHAPFFYLFYLLFLFFHHAFRPFSPTYLLLDIGAVLAFIPVFLWGYCQPWQRLWLPAALMFGFGVAVAQYNPGACTFFIYAAALAHGYTSVRRGVTHVLAVVVAVGIWTLLMEPPLYVWLPGMAISLFIGLINVMEGMRERHRDAQLKQQEEIEYLATVAERERIARDLHDLLGHTLSLITLKAELAGKLIGQDNERARSEIKDIEQAARTVLQEVREAVRGFRAGNLQQELKRIQQAMDVAGIRVNVQWSNSPLPPPVENVLCFILREAATNVLRHAGARELNIQLQEQANEVQLRIEDDGDKPVREEGNGLRGMRERVALLNGVFEFISGRGHTVVARLPKEANA